MDTKHLVERFAEAELELILARAPIVNGPGAHGLFQLDIRRHDARDARSEFFLCWPGAQDNLALVQAADRRERQLVLMVRERGREFYEAVPDFALRQARRRAIGAGYRGELAAHIGVKVTDVVEQRGVAYVRRFSPGARRHLLAGRDERQLFMCRLPVPCTSVRAAHDALRTPAAAAGRGFDRALRQGEWFFLTAPDGELAELELALARGRAIARRKVSIGAVIPRAGKPHLADELVVLVGERGERRVYVRGAIRHADHKTVYLDRWRQVVRNREVDEGRSLFGGRWMD